MNTERDQQDYKIKMSNGEITHTQWKTKIKMESTGWHQIKNQIKKWKMGSMGGNAASLHDAQRNKKHISKVCRSVSPQSTQWACENGDLVVPYKSLDPHAS